MASIKCPKCNTIIEIDDDTYSQLLSKIKNEEFEKELEKRKKLDDQLAASKLNEQIAKIEAKNNEEKVQLNAKLEQAKLNEKIAITDALDKQKELLNSYEKQILDLKNQIIIKDKDHQADIKRLNDDLKHQIDMKQQEVDYYKDFKARESTKAVGESLEQYCSDKFEAIRSAAFQNAYFKKDNDDKSGSKGDFIFRDFDQEGTEYVSIMFEMKNENDTTATKHKNEHFFDKLDKDRTTKNCEYAVLVSMLENDSALYNQGIVDVSYSSGYKKMYVIRPQFFIPLITLIRNAALTSLETKRALVRAKNENIDITNFENHLTEFKENVRLNYERAGNHYRTAIEQINKSIAALEKTKEELQKSEDNLRIATDKADEVTIKKLTKDSPTLKEKFDKSK